MNISIRPATVEDAEEIANIFVASVKTLCAKDYTNEQIEIIISFYDSQLYRSAIETETKTITVRLLLGR